MPTTTTVSLLQFAALTWALRGDDAKHGRKHLLAVDAHLGRDALEQHGLDHVPLEATTTVSLLQFAALTWALRG
jgi:hypothetical protein